jgi:hypothetical protein
VTHVFRAHDGVPPPLLFYRGRYAST